MWWFVPFTRDSRAHFARGPLPALATSGWVGLFALACVLGLLACAEWVFLQFRWDNAYWGPRVSSPPPSALRKTLTNVAVYGTTTAVAWMVAWVFGQHGRVERAYVAAGGILCAKCLHSLAGLGYTGRCPECGRPFHPFDDGPLWDATMPRLNPGAASKP